MILFRRIDSSPFNLCWRLNIVESFTKTQYLMGSLETVLLEIDLDEPGNDDLNDGAEEVPPAEGAEEVPPAPAVEQWKKHLIQLK